MTASGTGPGQERSRSRRAVARAGRVALGLLALYLAALVGSGVPGFVIAHRSGADVARDIDTFDPGDGFVSVAEDDGSRGGCPGWAPIRATGGGRNTTCAGRTTHCSRAGRTWTTSTPLVPEDLEALVEENGLGRGEVRCRADDQGTGSSCATFRRWTVGGRTYDAYVSYREIRSLTGDEVDRTLRLELTRGSFRS